MQRDFAGIEELRRSYERSKNKINKRFEKWNKDFEKFLANIPSIYKQLILISIPSLLYLIRGWQYIRVPQLYAEDGTIWLSSAYDRGFKSLFSPYNGFAHTTERLFALIVSLFPLKAAPLLFNLMGYGLFILTCAYLFSSRTKIFSNNYQKLFMAFSLGLIANFSEFFFNFSNSVFLLGVIGLCIYFAKPSKNITFNILEKLIFILACLTLPFAWFYLVIVLFEWIWRKKYNLLYLIVSAIGTVIQLFIHELSKYSRPDIPTTTLISSRYTLLEIYNQIVTPALRFARIDTNINIAFDKFFVIFIFCIILGGLSLFVLIKHGSVQLKYLTFFLVLFTVSALKGPLVGGNLSPVGILKFMDTAQFGNRYFFYGILCLLTIFAVAFSTYIKKQALYGFLALFVVFSLSTSLTSSAFKVNKGFSNYSVVYDKDISSLGRAKPGTIVKIPENPGGPWYIDLKVRN